MKRKRVIARPPTHRGVARDRSPVSVAEATATKRRRPGFRGLSYEGQLRTMLLPYVGGALLLVALPAFMSADLAFKQYDALSPPRPNGLQNFREIFADPLTSIAIANSLFFIALAVPLRVLGALSLALLLNHRRRGVGVYRTAAYLPTVVPDVAYALIWLWIFNPLYGPVNMILSAIGVAPPSWFVDPSTAKYPFVIMSVFQIGEGFVVLLAGLKDIPADYYEAGSVDGGSRFQLFRLITLPLLTPWLLLLTFRDVILSFQWTFTPSFLMTGGDPYYETLFFPLLIFEEAFDRFRFGTGSAMMLMMFVATGVLIGALYMIFRKRGYTGEA